MRVGIFVTIIIIWVCVGEVHHLLPPNYHRTAARSAADRQRTRSPVVVVFVFAKFPGVSGFEIGVSGSTRWILGSRRWILGSTRWISGSTKPPEPPPTLALPRREPRHFSRYLAFPRRSLRFPPRSLVPIKFPSRRDRVLSSPIDIPVSPVSAVGRPWWVCQRGLSSAWGCYAAPITLVPRDRGALPFSRPPPSGRRAARGPTRHGLGTPWERPRTDRPPSRQGYLRNRCARRRRRPHRSPASFFLLPAFFFPPHRDAAREAAEGRVATTIEVVRDAPSIVRIAETSHRRNRPTDPQRRRLPTARRNDI